MTNPVTKKNVISLTDYQKSGRKITRHEASHMLENCRDMALSRLIKTLESMFEKIDEDLSELADKANGLDEQHAFLNAQREARQKKRDIENTFKKQFMTLFGEKTSANQGEKIKKENDFSFDDLELSLVDEKEMEENIAISNMSNALQDNCESELQTLAMRIGFLMDSPEFDLKANPVSPEVIHNTFKAACQQMEAGFTVKMAIMKLFDRYLTKDLLEIYKDINKNLVSQQILPDIRPGYHGRPKKSRTQQANNSQQNSTGPSDTKNAGNYEHPHMDVGGIPQGQNTNHSQEVFSLLQQLLMKSNPASPLNAGHHQQSVANQGNFAAPMMQQMEGVDINAPMQPITTNFIDSLNHLQHGDSNFLSNIANELNVDMFNQGTLNILHELRNSSLTKDVPQFDAITIDIVAMLFDYIFEDPKVPEAMKNLLGRLQIPVLKVAMIDKKFFSSKSHPTRKLLDSLAAGAIGCGEHLSTTSPLYIETDRIIQHVLAEFESDVSLFDRLLEEFNAFLATEEKKSEKTVERSVKIIHDRERLEIARIVAENEVKKRTEDVESIPVVRNFLTTYWVLALTNAHASGGEDGEGWQNSLKAMDDLLWSIKPKMSAEERKQLVIKLPDLLKRLHAGMASISMDSNEQKNFFANLVTCHTRAVKAGLNTDPKPEANPELAWSLPEKKEVPEDYSPTILDAVNEAKEEAQIIRQNVAEGDVELEEVRLASEPLMAANESEDWISLMNNLKRGNWVDFKQEDGTWLRYKLSWVSPLKKVYLFTNISNQKALSISPQAMEIQFRQGKVSLLEDKPLIDRAVESMLVNLQPQN